MTLSSILLSFRSRAGASDFARSRLLVVFAGSRLASFTSLLSGSRVLAVVVDSSTLRRSHSNVKPDRTVFTTSIHAKVPKDELALGFRAAGYYGRSAVLLVAWVAAFALIRGVRDTALGFRIRELQHAAPV
jgi:hypothetical protein